MWSQVAAVVVVVSRVWGAETEHVVALWPPIGSDAAVVAKFLQFEVRKVSKKKCESVRLCPFSGVVEPQAA
jgi:hypothetical protein